MCGVRFHGGVVGLIAVAIVAGCDATSPLGSLDRQLGRAAVDYVVGEFAWTPDSHRIAYVSNGSDSRAYTVGATEHSSQAETDALPGENGTNRAVQLGTDPDAFYFTVVNGGCLSAPIYQSLAAGRIDTVATGASNGSFVASPSGNRVAFTAVAYPVGGQGLCPDFQDSLVVVDALGATRGQRRAIEVGIGWSDGYPLALADDGSLIYLGTDRSDPHNSRSVVRFAAVGSAPREVWRPTTDTSVSEAVALDVSWIAGTPHLTIAQSRRADRTATLTDLDVTSGRRATIATLSDVFEIAAFTRSVDGRAWAAWVYKSQTPMCVMERACVDARLLVSSPGATQPAELASFSGDEYPNRMKFSPDGGWVAFTYSSGLFVRAVR